MRGSKRAAGAGGCFAAPVFSKARCMPGSRFPRPFSACPGCVISWRMKALFCCLLKILLHCRKIVSVHGKALEADIGNFQADMALRALKLNLLPIRKKFNLVFFVQDQPNKTTGIFLNLVYCWMWGIFM
jgi:hypothetical protein